MYLSLFTPKDLSGRNHLRHIDFFLHSGHGKGPLKDQAASFRPYLKTKCSSDSIA
jgi:hypothetical protein